jgi:hypothetical protein
LFITADTDIDQTASNKDVDITPGFDGTPLDDFTAGMFDALLEKLHKNIQ